MVTESERTEVLAPVVPGPTEDADTGAKGRVARIVAVVAVVLAFVALVFGVLDGIARSAVQSAISDAVIDGAGLPPTQRVDTEISGPVLPQVVLGTLGRVTISSQNVNVAGGAADVTIVVDGLSLGDQPAARGVRGDVRIDAGQLSYMARAGQPSVDGLRALYGDEAGAALQPQALCLASELPAVLRVTSVAVEGQQLVARFAVDTTALDAASLAQKGACA